MRPLQPRLPGLQHDKPLLPKEIILGVKEALFVRSSEILGRFVYARLGGADIKAVETKAEREAQHEPMVGGDHQGRVLWACTNCGACMEICPVASSMCPRSCDMRRYLVMEESDFPQEVTPVFNNMERNGNPWEISNDTARRVGRRAGRADRWPSTPAGGALLGRLHGLVRRAQPEGGHRLRQGDAGRRRRFASWGRRKAAPATRLGASATSTSTRCWRSRTSRRLNNYGFGQGLHGTQWGSRDTGQVQHAAGVEPGRAYDRQDGGGDCPHCFNTIKNEYPQLGGTYEIVHHSDFIDR